MDYFFYRGRPIGQTINGQINPVDVDTNTPLFKWTFTDGGREHGYQILVSSSLRNLEKNIGDLWDTGYVRNWHFNDLRSQAYYSGMPLRPGVDYYWKIRTWNEHGVKGTYSDTASFTTALSLPDAKEEAKSIVFDSKNNELYHNSVRSLKERVMPNGFAPTSVTGAYSGQFVRDSSAHIFALLELQEYDLAKSMLRYLLDYFRDNQLPHIPHYIFLDKPPSMTVQVDTTYQFVMAWITYINCTGDLQTEREYYEMMRNYALGHLNSEFFHPELNLLWNPNYEHSRAPYFLSTYDLLTNIFASEALKLMLPIVNRYGDTKVTEVFKLYSEKIQNGIDNHLTYSWQGKRIYAELRFKDEPDQLLWGMSFLNLSPIAAIRDIRDVELMNNTLEVYEQVGSFMWGEYRVLHTAIQADMNVGGGQVIGKGFAWETLFNALRGKWNRLNLLHRFLCNYNPSPLLAESWNYEPFIAGEAYINDGGNQEQMAWYVWSQTRIRNLLS